jgi:hypothetical protein
VIGRATGCDVTLADPQVAMRHAELLHVEGAGGSSISGAADRPS